MDEVRTDFPHAELELIEMGTGRDDSPLARAANLAACLGLAARVLQRRRPDVVLVHGDRGEHLMVAFAALQLGLAVVHTQGGERSGNLDEIQRHAISKLAHLHFPETEDAGERLRRLGEDDWRIHVVGSTYVDRIVQGLYAPPSEARAAVGLGPEERFLLVLVHPETYLEREGIRAQAVAVLEAARRSGLRSVVTYPASDPGYEVIVEQLRALECDPAFVVRRNLDNDVYLGLMAGAEALLGNSSAALVEAPYFRLPAVNVGRRQTGRARDASVLDAEATVDAVLIALERARDPGFRHSLSSLQPRLGDGRASERIVAKLKATPLDARLLEKQLAY